MKRLTLLLVLALLLAGCSQSPPEVTDPSTQPPTQATDATEATQPPSRLDAGSPLTESTQGAVLVYATQNLQPVSLVPQEDGILLIGQGTLTHLTGAELGEEITLSVPQGTGLGTRYLIYNEKGIAYLNEAKTAYVLTLTGGKAQELPFPADSTGIPLLNRDLTTLYYATESGFYTLDIPTGQSLPLRQGETGQRQVLQLLFGGRVLLVQQGEQYLLLRTENGESLYQSPELPRLVTGQEGYYLVRQDFIQEHILGSWSGDAQALTAAMPYTDAFWAIDPDNGRLVTQTGTRLYYYDLQKGCLTAQINFPASYTPSRICLDSQGKVWFLAGKGELCVWDPARSPAQEQLPCLAPCYTQENPDTEGLEALESAVDALESKYDVSIQLDTAGLEPEGYTFTQEYRPQAFLEGLNRLDRCLAKVPEKVLQDLDTPVIHLVKDIQGPKEGSTTERLSRRDHLVLALEEDMDYQFFRSLYLLMDTRIFAETSLLDSWSDLNPRDFTYLLSYPQPQVLEALFDTYRSSGAFVDALALTYPREDRASLFGAYMTGELPEGLQEKWQLLERSINKAFGLKKENLPWGQRVW